MISATLIKTDLSVLEAINNRIKVAPSLMKIAYKRRVRKIRAAFKSAVQAPDQLPSLPFIWSYDPAAQARARRWWFAHLKGAGVLIGISAGRYQRTGQLVKAWEMTTIDNGNGLDVVVENPAKGADRVYGPRQVPSHYLTGWGEIDRIIEKQTDALNLGLIEDWYTVSDPFAGVGR